MAPNQYFLPVDSDLASCLLLHGTNAASLERIALEGLAPRSVSKSESHWTANPSHADAVYLTSSYAMYYASSCSAQGLHVILDVDIDRLDPALLAGDEDAFALSKVQGYEFLNALPVEERVAYWRENIRITDAEISLRVLGNCTHLGTIKPEAIKAVRLLSSAEVRTLTSMVTDPIISPQNFRLMGGANQRFHAWLMGRAPADDAAELYAWFDQVSKPQLPVMSLQEAAAFVRDQNPTTATSR